MAYYKIHAFPNQVDRYHDFITMGRIGIDWEKIGDATNLSDDDIKESLIQNYQCNNISAGMRAGYFKKLKSMRPGDKVIIPHNNKTLTFAEVTGHYQYLPQSKDIAHTVPIKVLTIINISLVPFKDMLRSINSANTITTLDKYGTQIEALIAGKTRKGLFSMSNYQYKDWQATDIYLESDPDSRFFLKIEKTDSKQLEGRKHILVAIMMNPSEADLTQSDRTVNNILKIASSNYYNQVEIYNLMPLYAKSLTTFFKSNMTFNSADIKNMADKNLNYIKQHLPASKKCDILLGTGALDDANLINVVTNESVLQIRCAFFNNYLAILQHLRDNQNIFVVELTKHGFPHHPSRTHLQLRPVTISQNLSLQLRDEK